MLQRLARTVLALVCCCAASSAADPQRSPRVRPIQAPVRDAGVYHVATGTWTRKIASAQIGADIVYNNTCSTGYFSALDGDAYVDEGRIPSPTSPTSATSRPGNQLGYTIDGFQIAYCTDQPGGPGTVTYNFYESYSGCTSVIGVTPTAGFAVTGLPGAIAPPTLACWIVTLDLASPPQTASLAFAMLADGDGVYSNGTADLFGWSQESNLPNASQAATGPIIAGDYNLCSAFDGTRWDSPVNYAEPGTGMSTQDFFFTENGPTTPGCYFFGGAPLASFHLIFYSQVCGTPGGPGSIFCPGDGSGTSCPCGNNSLALLPPGDPVGCTSSLNVGGRLRSSGGTSPCTYPPLGPGSVSISSDDLILLGSQMPNSSALYFQGTLQVNGGLGTVFGDGLRCAGGTLIRLGTKTNVGGTSQYPEFGDLSVSVKGAVTSPGVRTYQIWYRNAAVFCTAATFNLSNGLQVVWSL